jgi:hypothetical protein
LSATPLTVRRSSLVVEPKAMPAAPRRYLIMVPRSLPATPLVVSRRDT